MAIERSYQINICNQASAQAWLVALKRILPPGTAVVATAREIGPRHCQATFRVRLSKKTIVSVASEACLGQAIDGAAHSLFERLRGNLNQEVA